MIVQLTNLYTAIISTAPVTEDGALAYDESDIEGVFLFSCTWSIGGALVGPSRVLFNSFLRELSTGSTPSDPLHDSFYDLEEHRWKTWETRVPDYEQPVPFRFSQIMVPTSDNVLYTYLLNTVMGAGRPVLFVGEPGTAKTVTIETYLR